MGASGSLWVITSYYNPVGYRRRFENYHRFRAQLNHPLATAELSFDGKHRLGDGDADLLLHLHGGDVLWQKERLLNLLLERLPAECRVVAWVDCDLLFQRRDWSERAVAALDAAALVQPFHRAHHLAPDVADLVDGQTLRADGVLRVVESAASRIASGSSIESVLARATDRGRNAPTPGFAWVARRELVARHGFYDACIVGGGDTALACAAFGAFEQVIRLHDMNRQQRARYLAWAEPFHRDVRGAVAAIDGDLGHLWHGDIADRHAADRHRGLTPHAFDPHVDIAIADSGPWRWATDKPELHRYVGDYFRLRREDG